MVQSISKLEVHIMSTNDNKKPFETASATTDPDNSNSGPFAFIITGVCLAVLLGLGLLISSVDCAHGGCISNVGCPKLEYAPRR